MKDLKKLEASLPEGTEKNELKKKLESSQGNGLESVEIPISLRIHGVTPKHILGKRFVDKPRAIAFAKRHIHTGYQQPPEVKSHFGTYFSIPFSHYKPCSLIQ